MEFAILGDIPAKFGGNNHFFAAGRQNFPQKLLIGKWSINCGAFKKVTPSSIALWITANESFFGEREVALGKSHAAQTKLRSLKFAQFSFLHSMSPGC